MQVPHVPRGGLAILRDAAPIDDDARMTMSSGAPVLCLDEVEKIMEYIDEPKDMVRQLSSQRPTLLHPLTRLEHGPRRARARAFQEDILQSPRRPLLQLNLRLVSHEYKRTVDKILSDNELLRSRLPQPLLFSCAAGLTNDIRLLGQDVHCRDGTPALHRAARLRCERVVRRLLDAGADVGARDSLGRTALHRAALNGHAGIVHMLCDAGPQHVNDASQEQRTALHMAASVGAVDVVKVLCAQERIYVDARRNGGRTPLHDAAGRGYTEVVAALLSAGASFGARDTDGRIALQLAAGRPGYSLMVELICKAGPERVNESSKCHGTALHIAARQGLVDNVKVLCAQERIDLDARMANGRTPLHEAAERGHTEVVEALLCAGASVSAFDRKGRTTLELAPTGRHHWVAQLLQEVSASGSARAH